MLEEITIINFKRIGDPGITLSGLTNVNYLVGENGSGKSSVLEALSVFFATSDHFDGGNFSILDKNNSLDIKSHFLKTGSYITLKNNDKSLKLEKTKDINDGNFVFTGHSAEFKDVKLVVMDYENLLLGDKENKSVGHLEKVRLTTDSTFSDEILQSVIPFFFDKQVENVFSSKREKANYKIDGQNVGSHLFSIAGGFKSVLIMCKNIAELINSGNSKIIVLIEEPEVFLHPKAQKKFPEFLDKFFKNPRVKFIISTHSPFIINSALELDNQKVYHIQDGQCVNPKGLSKKETQPLYDIYSGLGIYPSDLLFSNCLIWVEGPVDMIYINFRLEKYMQQDDCERRFEKGINYEFAIFGGASVVHYEENISIKKTIIKKLKFAEVHPKSFIVFDNDLSKNKVKKQINENKLYWSRKELEIGKIINPTRDKPFKNSFTYKSGSIIVGDDSTFQAFKIKLLESERQDYYCNTDPNFYTIESYRLDDYVPTKNKYKKAISYLRKYTKKGTKYNFLDVIKPEGEEMIEKIYKFIKVNN